MIGLPRLAAAVAAASLLVTGASATTVLETRAKPDVQALAAQTARNSGVVPGGYIVELEPSAQVGSVLGKRSDGQTDHEAMYRHLRRRGVTFDIRQEFNSAPDLFYGASVVVGSDADAAHLASIPGVKNISPIVMLHIGKPDGRGAPASAGAKKRGLDADLEERSVVTTTTGVVTKAGKGGSSMPVTSHNVYARSADKKPCHGKSGGGGKAIPKHPAHHAPKPPHHKAKRPNKPRQPSTANTYGPHVQTGVSKLQALGHDGAGVNIALIDAGIDYTHPLLGGCFGKGCRVAKGYDFVGENYTATGVATPDPDPFSNCYVGGHGTFTAGVAAGGVDASIGWGGVAPAATIFAYRVADCDRLYTGNDILMAAVMRAVSDGADIISVSLAGLTGWKADIIPTFFDNVVRKSGVIISSSAGNDGAGGLFLNTYPSTGQYVIATGETYSPTTVQFNLTTSSGYGPITYRGSHSFNVTNAATYFPANYGCDASDFDGAPDLSNKVAVIQRGYCALATKVSNAADAGAQNVLIYYASGQDFGNINYVDGAYAGLTNGHAGLISNDQGQYLVDNPNVTLTSTSPHLYQPPQPNAGLIQAESEVGPTFDLFKQIDVLVPSWWSFSLFPVALGSFNVDTGTSFGAPYTAGVIALYIQHRRLRKPYDAQAIAAALTWTATPTSGSYGYSGLDTTAAQGGGLINAYEMLYAPLADVSPSVILLNDTVNHAGKQTIKLRNAGLLPKVYTFTHQPSPTINYLDPSSIYPAAWPPAAVSNASAKVTFANRGKLIVLPGLSASMAVQIDEPTGVPASQFPLYSGYIAITSADGADSFSVPYFGIVGSMKQLPLIDTGSQVSGFTVPAIMDSNGNIQTGPETYDMTDNQPTLAFRAVGGSPLWTVEAVPASFQMPPASNKSNAVLPVSSVAGRLGSWPAFPLLWIQRSTNGECDGNCPGNDVFYYTWNGQVTSTNANGTSTTTTLPNGKYKALVSLQKITGNGNNWYDFEHYLSPEMDIQYAS